MRYGKVVNSKMLGMIDDVAGLHDPCGAIDKHLGRMHIDMSRSLALYVEEIGLCVQRPRYILSFQVLPCQHRVQLIVGSIGLNVPIHALPVLAQSSDMNVCL